MSDMMLAFHPRQTLDDRVVHLLSEFKLEWERYWGLSDRGAPQDKSLTDEDEIRRLYETADRLSRAAENLSPFRLPDERRTLPGLLSMEAESERKAFEEWAEGIRLELGEEPFGDPNFWNTVVVPVRDHLSPNQQREVFFRTALELAVFERFAVMPGPAASRTVQLLGFLVTTRSERARDYLRRVSRCFILDARPELAVMCRAVMEAALEDQDIDDGIVERILKAQNRRFPGLSTWIEAAAQAGVLDPVGRAAADAVKDAGDHVVHRAPGLAPDASEVLQNLKTVLEQLALSKP